MTHSAKRGRNGPSPSSAGCSPPRKRALTTLPPFLPLDAGIAMAAPASGEGPGGSFFPAASEAGTSVTAKGGFLKPLLRTRLKKAAVDQKSSCVQDVKGWLWHSAHWSCTPRKKRAAEAVSRLGCG